jgi:hypothetical protein
MGTAPGRSIMNSLVGSLFIPYLQNGICQLLTNAPLLQTNPPETLVPFYDDKRVFLKDNINPGSKEIFWLPPSKILSENLLYGTLVGEGNGHLIKFNSFEMKKVD